MSFTDDKKLKVDSLDEISGGMYNVTPDQALANAKSLGEDLGGSYLDKWQALRVEKFKKEYESLKSRFNESQKSADKKGE